MNKKDFIDTIFILIIILGLIILAEGRGYELYKKQLEVNELQNKVEQQIELIDALKQ
jgi:hypothetical protein